MREAAKIEAKQRALAPWFGTEASGNGDSGVILGLVRVLQCYRVLSQVDQVAARVLFQVLQVKAKPKAPTTLNP